MPTIKVKNNGVWEHIAIGGGSGNIDIDLDGVINSEPNYVNADTLGGISADEYASKSFVRTKIAEAQLGDGHVDLSDYVTKEELPSKTSELINDSNYITSDAEQNLTEEQKARARENIGVVTFDEVTPEDEGKVLSVKNGVASWENIQVSSDGDSSVGGIAWDDLADTVIEETDLFAKETVNGFYSNSSYYGLYSMGRNFPESGLDYGLTDSFTITVGETYIVEWDGVEYETVGFDASAVLPNAIALGNGSNFGLSGNSEPFVVGVISGYGVEFISLTEQVASHTIRIYKKEEARKVIKFELLPANLQLGETIDTIALIDGDYKITFIEDYGWKPEIIPILSGVHLTEGETYTVIWDGVEYSCVAFVVQGLVCIGNTAIQNEVDSGEPFVIAEDIDGITEGVSGFNFMTLEEPDPTVATEVYYNIKVTYTGKIFKKLDDKYLNLHQSNWNETNVSSAAYIKNRPFGTIPADTVIVKETSVSCNMQDGESVYYGIIPTVGFILGAVYAVEIDGVCRNVITEDLGDGAIGFEVDGVGVADNLNGSGMSILISNTQGKHTYKITAAEDIVKKIDSKYLPDDIGDSSLPKVTTEDNGKVMTVVDGVWDVVEVNHPIELPTITSEDEGKILTVSNGNWSVKENTHPIELPEATADDAGKFLRVGSDGSWVLEMMQNVSEVGL